MQYIQIDTKFTVGEYADTICIQSFAFNLNALNVFITTTLTLLVPLVQLLAVHVSRISVNGNKCSTISFGKKGWLHLFPVATF